MLNWFKKAAGKIRSFVKKHGPSVLKFLKQNKLISRGLTQAMPMLGPYGKTLAPFAIDAAKRAGYGKRGRGLRLAGAGYH